MLNISTLYKTEAATAIALENIRSHTLKAINRAGATMLFIDMHGFFEANPAVTSIRMAIRAEGNIGDDGHAYTSFSLETVGVEVKADVRQSVVYGFEDVTYDDLGQIKLEDLDLLVAPLSNDDLVAALKDRLQDYDRNQDWIETELLWKVGNPEGRDVTFKVNRIQVDHAGDILLRRLVDGDGKPTNPTEQQIQDAQDEVIGWVEYQ